MAQYKKYDPVFYPAELQQIGHLPNCIDYDTIPLSELVISQTMIGVMWLRYKLSLFAVIQLFLSDFKSTDNDMIPCQRYPWF